jgi:hypothetical protein
MDELKPSGKPFEITKWEVWEAYRQVKANRGAPGVDGVTLEEFDKDLKNNLYKIWNQMSSGSYFPPPVLAVEIPKPHGGGTRILGIPTISDRVAQTVVARRLELKVEPIFHPGSYGYRPYRSALDAVAVCRERAGRPTGCSISLTRHTAWWSSCRPTPVRDGWWRLALGLTRQKNLRPLSMPRGPCGRPQVNRRQSRARQ